MKRRVILFFSAVVIFWGCEEKMKRVTIPAKEGETVEETTIEEPPKSEFMTLEEIAEIANKGSLELTFPKARIVKEILVVNEGMDHVKVIWLNKGDKHEVRIDFRPRDSTKVFRVSVEGRENKFISKTGVKPGMSIDELNSANRKPVDFFGFDWDFGGAVKFNGGVLEDKNIFVYLKTDKKYGKRFMGDSPHTFEEAKEAKLDLYINRIVYEPTKFNQL